MFGLCSNLICSDQCTFGSRAPATISLSELSCTCPNFRREKFADPTRYVRAWSHCGRFFDYDRSRSQRTRSHKPAAWSHYIFCFSLKRTRCSCSLYLKVLCVPFCLTFFSLITLSYAFAVPRFLCLSPSPARHRYLHQVRYCSLSLTGSGSLFLTRARSHSLFLTRSHSLFLTRSHSLFFTRSRSLFLTRSRSLFLTRSRSLFLIRSRSLFLTRSRSLFLTRSRSLFLTRSRSLFLTRSRSLFVTRSRYHVDLGCHPYTYFTRGVSFA